MKFNPNCVRDILIECENSADGFQELYIEERNIPDTLSQYLWSELLYHLNQCKMSNLFDEHSGEDILGGFTVNNLSPDGHAFLQKIQSNTIWKKLLKKGIVSLPALISAATEIVGMF